MQVSTSAAAESFGRLSSPTPKAPAEDNIWRRDILPWAIRSMN